ncbi:MAG: hypothetical protein E7485_10215 [Ruminococcaceae bacterium]|nr:hypothetical protein [Oscillospiraceae bacterium]
MVDRFDLDVFHSFTYLSEQIFVLCFYTRKVQFRNKKFSFLSAASASTAASASAAASSATAAATSAAAGAAYAHMSCGFA